MRILGFSFLFPFPLQLFLPPALPPAPSSSVLEASGLHRWWGGEGGREGGGGEEEEEEEDLIAYQGLIHRLPPALKTLSGALYKLLLHVYVGPSFPSSLPPRHNTKNTATPSSKARPPWLG